MAVLASRPHPGAGHRADRAEGSVAEGHTALCRRSQRPADTSRPRGAAAPLDRFLARELGRSHTSADRIHPAVPTSVLGVVRKRVGRLSAPTAELIAAAPSWASSSPWPSRRLSWVGLPSPAWTILKRRPTQGSSRQPTCLAIGVSPTLWSATLSRRRSLCRTRCASIGGRPRPLSAPTSSTSSLGWRSWRVTGRLCHDGRTGERRALGTAGRYRGDACPCLRGGRSAVSPGTRRRWA